MTDTADEISIKILA